ncbi:hypothetical protein [Streptomyces roseicoloratus]|uniref:Integral membrane protein n=1 Tax=Streptomyces roseicoloratus TaxID=2508722 RepID=A0ABY9S703_9ACTN|nr:hypothetical protein [Streptomyces roseicoloratus]WMX49154.1 hypothetical protein RGF97_29815 [Streptomyces roseicoloratus]
MMSGPTKTMGVITFATLVLITAYTVALGSSGWLWFGWVVLGVATIGMAAADAGEPRLRPPRARHHRPGPQP